MALDDGRRDAHAADPRASPPLALVIDLCDTSRGAHLLFWHARGVQQPHYSHSSQLEHGVGTAA